MARTCESKRESNEKEKEREREGRGGGGEGEYGEEERDGGIKEVNKNPINKGL